MLRSFVILVIITTNLCSTLDSYKIHIDESSRIIDTYDQQDSDLHEEYGEDTYSSENSYTRANNGRVVIGKWRNNGEALEPKWRDGDSVPLAPFSTISFQSRRAKESKSQEGYEIEPDVFVESGNDKHPETTSKHEFVSDDKQNLNPNSKHRDNKDNKNSKTVTKGINSATLIPTTETYPDYYQSKQGIQHKNGSPRNDREFSVPEDFDERAGYPSERRSAVSKLSSKFREPLRRDNARENIQREGLKSRETLENHPKDEYELFEDQDDDPRPRKRRPPENYEYSGTWVLNSRKGESHAEDDQRAVLQTQPLTMANDIRRYLMDDHDSLARIKNQTKSQDNGELKTYLKMQGTGLSLSEILQQKNLTLADLLKGKPNAINILKSNNGSRETLQKEETSERVSTIMETMATSLPPRRILDVTQLSQNSNLNNRNILNTSPTSFDVETTTTTPMTMEINNANEDWVSTEMMESSSNPTTLNNDIKSVSFKKLEPVEQLQEFLKPLENRGSLAMETTTVVAEVAESVITKGHSLASNKQKIPENNDDDEIMEFSDYPGLKMPKFIGPVVYETQSLGNRRKIFPLSAIRKSNPVEDPDSKLSIEHILSSQKKTSTMINETDDLSKASHKTISEEVKNIDAVNTKQQGTRPKLSVDETEGAISTPNDYTIPRVKEYGNSFNVSESKVRNDQNERTVQMKIEETVKKERWMNGQEMMPKERKNLTLNHKLHEIVIPKVDPQSRAEILELFSSGSSAERLERLLASRNMTIEELIALRQRGSSQVHFEQVFKAKEINPTSLTRNFEADSKNHTHEIPKKIINVIKDNDTSSNIENNNNLVNSQNNTTDKKVKIVDKDDEYSTIELVNEFSQNKNLKKNFSIFEKINRDFYPLVAKVVPNMEPRKEVNTKENLGDSDQTMLVQTLPIENNIQKDSEGSAYYTSIEAVKLPVLDDEIKKIPDIFRERNTGLISSVNSGEIGRVEEILNNDLKLLTNGHGINNFDYTEKKALSKVKPSIIASGGILGVTIVVFLSIFIACRIQQKKKFAYKNSFTKAVFHNPVMAARKLSNTSSINSIAIDVVATSTPKRPQKHDAFETKEDFEVKSDIDNDSLDANDSWDTIPDFMK